MSSGAPVFKNAFCISEKLCNYELKLGRYKRWRSWSVTIFLNKFITQNIKVFYISWFVAKCCKCKGNGQTEFVCFLFKTLYAFFSKIKDISFLHHRGFYVNLKTLVSQQNYFLSFYLVYFQLAKKDFYLLNSLLVFLLHIFHIPIQQIPWR